MSDAQNNAEEKFPITVQGDFLPKALAKLILPANDTELALEIIRANGAPIPIESRNRILDAIEFENEYDKDAGHESKDVSVSTSFQTYVTIEELSRILQSNFANVAIQVIRINKKATAAPPQSQIKPAPASLTFGQAAEIMCRSNQSEAAAEAPAPVAAEPETPTPEAAAEPAPAEPATAEEPLLEDADETGPAPIEPEPEAEAAPHAGANGAAEPSATQASDAKTATARRPRLGKDPIYPASYDVTKGDKTIRLYGHHILALHVMLADKNLTRRTDIEERAKEADVKFVGYKPGKGAHIIQTTFPSLMEGGFVRGVGSSKRPHNVALNSRAFVKEVLSGARHHAKSIAAAKAAPGLAPA